MHLGNPILALHAALAAAVHQDLPNIEYETRDFDAEIRLRGELGRQEFERRRTAGEIALMKKCVRRPSDDDVEVMMFPQTWGSTALGYGGVGGAAMTPAYTVVVTMANTACVYFAGRALAYAVPLSAITKAQRTRWEEDMRSNRVLGRRDALEAYGAQLPSREHD